MSYQDPNVDYYDVLSIPPTATAAEIRKAYKVAALKTHPDRLPVDHPDRPSRTRQFQLVNDAYFTLSDTGRRREYDAIRPRYTRPSTRSQTSGADYGAGAGASSRGPWNSGAPAGGWQDQQFSEFFEEMMEEEGLSGGVNGGAGAGGRGLAGKLRLWGIVGALSGAVLGYIIYNTTGALAGLVVGSQLGGIRDRKGKSVYEAFQEMPQNEKMRILSELASRILSGAMTS